MHKIIVSAIACFIAIVRCEDYCTFSEEKQDFHVVKL